MSSTSSTKRSEQRVTYVVGIAGIAVGLCLLGQSVLSDLACWAESGPRHYLWRHEEWLQLFTADNYVERGRGRILLTGPSEAREAFLIDRLEEAFPKEEAYQNALSMGTMEDVLLLLEYIEGAYGREAVPDRIVLGVTPRFLFNYPPVERTPLAIAIDRYSPFFRVDHRADRVRLAPRTSILRAFVADLRFSFKQGRRYRSGLEALALELIRRTPLPVSGDRLETKLKPYKYHHLPPLSKDHYRAHFTRNRFGYTVDEKRAEVRADAERLRALCRRNGVRLYVVILPSGPWLDDHYEPGFQPAFLELTRRAYGEERILDLTRLLGPHEFYDHTHCTKKGAERITRRVVRMIRSREEARR